MSLAPAAAALVSILVCRTEQPAVCQTVALPVVNDASGAPPTMLACQAGPLAQTVAIGWLARNRGWTLRRTNCSWSNGPLDKLIDRIASPRA